MPAKKKDKSEVTDTTVRCINKEEWERFRMVCKNNDTDRSTKIRRYIKRCAEEGKII